MVRVMVCGALGRMGREVVKTVVGDDRLQLVAAVDIRADGQDAGAAAGLKTGVTVVRDLTAAIEASHPDVGVDFTQPAAAMANIRTMLAAGVRPVVGTTGLTLGDLDEVGRLCDQTGLPALIAPNFALGAVLMMKLAVEVARYMPQVEIIELHHDQKLDAPSGTALRTAQLIAAVRGELRQGHPEEEEKLAGVRGGTVAGIPVHSVRLPGYVAHQEVIFGGLGQTLTIRHDSISRESFMPGVALACRKITGAHGLVYGLENIM
ncbi:MAG: 4-hydroxy-tetrahydrodipicolinate reductase [Negativicutes bacterium]|nr:4-hydroxy-tetrahydrodipicolinate reductase [Negativicutes bacterium]